MKKIINIGFLSLFFFSGVLYSQEGKYDSLTTFAFKWSNDFEVNTDYYFTNGFAFELVISAAKANPVTSILFPFSKNGESLYSYTLAQDIFTPKEKFYIPDQLNGDRPFAAYILLGLKKITFDINSKIKTYSELQIGVLGPAALGEEVQNGIHNNLPTSGEVIGWENQISNSIMLNYSLSIEKNYLLLNWLDFSGIVSAKLGLPFTNGSVGVKSRIGFFDLLPNEFEFISNNKWQLYLTLAASAAVVGYNATLQGGIFSKSIYTLDEVNRFIGNADIGITFFYKGFELEYVQHFNTPEFSEAVSHSWGYLLLKARL